MIRWRLQFYGHSVNHCWDKTIWLSTWKRQKTSCKRKRKKIKIRQGIMQIKRPLNFSSDCMNRNIVSKISVEVFQLHLAHSFFVKSISGAKMFQFALCQFALFHCFIVSICKEKRHRFWLTCDISVKLSTNKYFINLFKEGFGMIS